MKKIIFFVMVMCCAVLSSIPVSWAGAEKIVVAVDAEYPPYMYGNAKEAKGLYPKLISAVFSKMGVEAEITALPWKRALRYGEEGKVAIGGIYKNNERLEIYDYSDPIYEESLAIFVNKGNTFKFEGMNDLKGKKVGINLGWSYGEEFDKARKEKIFTTDEAQSNFLNLKKLTHMRVDCVVMDTLAASQIIEKEKLGSDVERLAKPATVNFAYLVIAKSQNKKKLLAEFNKTLAAMKTDGTYAKVVDDFIKGSD